MGFTETKIDNITEFTIENDVLTVEYKWHEKETYEHVYARYYMGYIDFRDIVCDEIDFRIRLKDDVSYE